MFNNSLIFFIAGLSLYFVDCKSQKLQSEITFHFIFVLLSFEYKQSRDDFCVSTYIFLHFATYPRKKMHYLNLVPYNMMEDKKIAD
jgi:hypothetical protein